MLSLKKQLFISILSLKQQDNVKALEKELKSTFQLWSKKIENRDVDSIDCGIAFEDRVYFEDKINENLNSLNFEMLEVGLVEGEKQELKLLVKELEQLLIELVENFEYYNNHLVERPHQNIFDNSSDFSVDEIDEDDLSESFFDGVSDFSDDEISVDSLSENSFDGVSDFSDDETDDDEFYKTIRHRILNHRIVLHDINREIDEVNV